MPKVRMSNRSAHQRGVPVAAAKQLLDGLLERRSKADLARRTGLSRQTLLNIDDIKHQRIDWSTLVALRKIAGEKG